MTAADLTPGQADKRPRLPAWRKLDLLHDLALGELTQEALGEKYDRHRSWVSEFANKPENKEAIQRIRSAGMDRLAGLWAADKGKRVSQLQEYAERLTLGLDEDKPDPNAVRTAAGVLRNVAEELGQITQKIEGSHTVYQVEGVPSSDMQ